MSRVLWLVLDSLGIGALPDAERFGDAGSNTLGHIADWCARPVAQGGRGAALRLPMLERLGLGQALQLASGRSAPGLASRRPVIGYWGAAQERSTGKDTVSGHWELCGLPVDFEWGYFPRPDESFPDDLVSDLAQAAGCDGRLGRCHASGTEIIQRLGEQHLSSGWPIVYTSADSVVQIAAHEQVFGLDRLYALCEFTRKRVDQYSVGRVIARPFLGSTAQGFRRTDNRRDWAVPPPAPTLLDVMQEAGRHVIAVGKIRDIFSGRGISESIKAHGIPSLMRESAEALRRCPPGGMVFCNLVDFDQSFGHRRDVAGYATALEDFDQRLRACLSQWRAEDLLLLTADHGNDPTWTGSDHTREHIPILLYSPALRAGSIGLRSSFADVGQSLSAWFELPVLDHGHAFLPPAPTEVSAGLAQRHQ